MAILCLLLQLKKSLYFWHHPQEHKDKNEADPNPCLCLDLNSPWACRFTIVLFPKRVTWHYSDAEPFLRVAASRKSMKGQEWEDIVSWDGGIF